jgi:tetratricopeptide (TPR) repeat protein
MATPDSFPRAIAAARSALRLDETMVLGHSATAVIKLYHEWDWDGAEQAFQRALELNPSEAMAHYHYAWYLALFGRLDEAIFEHKRARELDPLNPLHTAYLGLLYLMKRQDKEAIEEAQKSLELNPDFATGLSVLGRAYVEKGMYEEAIAAHQKLVEVAPLRGGDLGRTYALAGQRDEARKMLAELEKRKATPFVAFELAILYTALGEKDEAFRWLNYEHPHAFFPWFRVLPEFESLRDDPRFKVLLRKMNLPDLE